MILGRRMLKIGLAVFFISSSTTAEELMKDNFESQPETRWSYFSDQVMGGISQGRVTFGSQDRESFAHMTGQVSTEKMAVLSSCAGLLQKIVSIRQLAFTSKCAVTANSITSICAPLELYCLGSTIKRALHLPRTGKR